MSGSSRRLAFVLIAALSLALSASAGQAALILPGNSAVASASAFPTGTQLIALNAPFSTSTFSGSLVTQVFQNDLTNPLGGLTFIYQLVNDASSPDSIERLTGIDYSTVATDMSYALTAGSQAPSTVTRSSGSGSVVGFNFSPAPLGVGELLPGMTSGLLIVRTNASAFQASTASVIDGSTATVGSFGPAVPEPASLSLLGLAGLAVGRRRR